MTGSVAIGQARVRSRATSAADALNKLNLALDEIILSSSTIANGTSTVLDSAVIATPSASVSQSQSAVPSESAASAVESSASAQSSFSSSLTGAVSEPVASAVTISATSVTVTASQRITSTPASETPAASASNSSSSPEQPLNVPKNAAVSSVSSSAALTSSSAATTAKSGTFESNVTSSLASPTSSPSSASSSSARPSAVLTSSSVDTPGTTSRASITSTEAPAPAPSKPSSASVAISTQRAQTSTSKASSPSSTDIQAADSGSSGTTPDAAEQQLTTAAPQPGDTSSSSAVQGPTPSSNANSRDSQPSVTASSNVDSTVNIGNSLLGVTSSSSNIRADTTLLTAKAITVTSGSSTFTTTPAFITSISVSSGTDGASPQTFTSIFANPTIVSKSADLSDPAFWDNRGAVAGVFTVVALATLAVLFGIFYCWRSRHQRLGHGSATNAQFHRFSGPPDMSQPPTTYQAVRGFNLAPPSYRDDPQRHLMASSITSGLSNGHENPASMQCSDSQASRHSSDVHAGTLGLTGVLANPSGNIQSYGGPFSDYHRYISTGDIRLSTPPGGPVGIAFSSDFATETKPAREPEPAVERRSPSPAPSSPSVYPPSLPAVPEKDEDDYLFYERETTRRSESQFPSPPPKAVINDTDSRNPFASPLDSIHDSALEQNVPPVRILTEQAYRPLTPPDSSPGHSPATPRFPGAMESTKPLNPFSNAFLGRSVSIRIEPLSRPMRNPLRLSASGSSLKDKESV